MMMIFAYDHREIIMTDRVHVEQHVWQQRIIVTGCKNCAERCTKPDLTCWGMGHSFCTTMHARTWGRFWPICWVSTSGKCYLTRNAVHAWVHQTSTYSPSWKSPCVDTVFPPCKRFLQRLPEPSEDWKWYPNWNSKSFETLGRGHREAGELRRRIVKRYCLK
jgi:hypothetical protein